MPAQYTPPYWKVTVYCSDSCMLLELPNIEMWHAMNIGNHSENRHEYWQTLTKGQTTISNVFS